MDLTPGEKAVLRQIGVLYSTAGERDQQFKALFMQWAPSHHDAYQKAYGGLVAKQLVQDAGGQSFWITDSGLKAIGVAIPRPIVQVTAPQQMRPMPRAETPSQTQASRKRGVLSRLMTGLLGKSA
jgi:hypothetical protein